MAYQKLVKFLMTVVIGAIVALLLLSMGEINKAFPAEEALDKAKQQLQEQSKDGGYTVKEVKWVNQDPVQVALLKKALKEFDERHQ